MERLAAKGRNASFHFVGSNARIFAGNDAVASGQLILACARLPFSRVIALLRRAEENFALLDFPGQNKEIRGAIILQFDAPAEFFRIDDPKPTVLLLRQDRADQKAVCL